MFSSLEQKLIAAQTLAPSFCCSLSVLPNVLSGYEYLVVLLSFSLVDVGVVFHGLRSFSLFVAQTVFLRTLFAAEGEASFQISSGGVEDYKD
jgi:hypothetical protein